MNDTPDFFEVTAKAVKLTTVPRSQPGSGLLALKVWTEKEEYVIFLERDDLLNVTRGEEGPLPDRGDTFLGVDPRGSGVAPEKFLADSVALHDTDEGGLHRVLELKGEDQYFYVHLSDAALLELDSEAYGIQEVARQARLGLS